MISFSIFSFNKVSFSGWLMCKRTVFGSTDQNVPPCSYIMFIHTVPNLYRSRPGIKILGEF